MSGKSPRETSDATGASEESPEGRDVGRVIKPAALVLGEAFWVECPSMGRVAKSEDSITSVC